VDDLSALLKYLIEKSQVIPQFDSDLKYKFNDQWSTNGVHVNVKKTKVMRFNPLKRDVACPDPWYPTTSTAVVLGVTFSDDCSFGPHVTNLVRKGNYALRSLTSLRRLGFSIKQLLLAYTRYVHPLLEYA
jgi:hypothetical protein